jgi:hypothetical protein
MAEPISYRSLIANPNPTRRRPSLASQPGRVPTSAALTRPLAPIAPQTQGR